MLVLPAMDGNDPGMARFAADADAIGHALAAARRFAEAHALSPDMTARLAIIVEELVANLVEHGGARGEPIELGLARRPGEIGLTLIDGGTFFDPRDAPLAATVPERGGGAGIALILAWARITGYARSGGYNQLDLALPLTE